MVVGVLSLPEERDGVNLSSSTWLEIYRLIQKLTGSAPIHSFHSVIFLWEQLICVTRDFTLEPPDICLSRKWDKQITEAIVCHNQSRLLALRLTELPANRIRKKGGASAPALRPSSPCLSRKWTIRCPGMVPPLPAKVASGLLLIEFGPLG